jgi:uncharacterized protein
MQDLHVRLHDDLTAALRARDGRTVRVLRTVLSAIANAEARTDVEQTPTSRRSAGGIAGAAAGIGAADVDRRTLTAQDLVAIVAAERDERLAAADEMAGRGAPEAAEDLRAEAALLAHYLPDAGPAQAR